MPSLLSLNNFLVGARCWSCCTGRRGYFVVIISSSRTRKVRRRRGSCSGNNPHPSVPFRRSSLRFIFAFSPTCSTLLTRQARNKQEEASSSSSSSQGVLWTTFIQAVTTNDGTTAGGPEQPPTSSSQCRSSCSLHRNRRRPHATVVDFCQRWKTRRGVLRIPHRRPVFPPKAVVAWAATSTTTSSTTVRPPKRRLSPLPSQGPSPSSRPHRKQHQQP